MWGMYPGVPEGQKNILRDFQLQLNSNRLENFKKKRRSTPCIIGVVLISVFLISGILAIIAQIIAYYPLWLFSIIMFIAGIFLLMVEIFLLYALFAGRRYDF